MQGFIAEGVNDVFGVTGSHVVDIFDALYRFPKLRITAARHECAAAYMACTYALLTGRTGVCVTTAGPGLLNAVNGLAQAQFSALPVVCISGGVPVGAPRYDLHGLESESCYVSAVANVVKSSRRITSPDDLPDALAEAFRSAESARPGPAYVEIPWNLFSADAGESLPDYTIQEREVFGFDKVSTSDAAAAIATASHPLIAIDKGFRYADNDTPLSKLAKQVQCPVITTRDALGAIPTESSCFAGVLHEHVFGPFAFDALQAADVCVAIGFDEDSGNSRMLEAGTSADIVHIRMATGANASLAEVNEALVDASDCCVISDVDATNAVARRSNAMKSLRNDLASHGNSKPIHFGYALTRLARHIESDAITVVDAGSHEVWARSVLAANSQHSIIGGHDWASMGFAIPGSVAARVARPKNRVICITGDGCLLMSLSDLSTLIEVGGPTLVVNLNDAEYGMMSQVHKNRFGRVEGTRLPEVDYAVVARAFGATAVHVEDPGDLDAALEAAFSSDTPWFIDVACDSQIAYPTFKET